MKNLLLSAVLMFCAASPQFHNAQTLCAEAKNPQAQPFTWGLYWGASWEEIAPYESGPTLYQMGRTPYQPGRTTLANRGEFRLGYAPAALHGRALALDKRPFDLAADPPWLDEKSKAVSSLGGGLYHKTTGSRFLYSVLDEWGLSARIRSPWIRGAPFAENHKPLMADLKTVTSATKEAEAYLYLSSPWLSLADTGWSILETAALRGFASAQTKAAEFNPDFGGGIELEFESNSSLSFIIRRLLLEGFYTEALLPAKNSSSWFANPPPLPEREFNLYGMGLLWDAPYWSLSSDWALSETFALGRDMYANVGVRFQPATGTPGGKAGPWAFSLAADGAGKNFTGRDGSNPGAGFRTAGKIEYKGMGSSLFRLNTTLRSPGFGEAFNRSSSSIYYRFPALSKKKAAAIPLRVTRISLGLDRNARNPEKILDSIDGAVSLSLGLFPAILKSPVGINVSGQLNSLCSADETPSPYPLPIFPYTFDSAKATGEITWFPDKWQFRTKWGYEIKAEKEGHWDASFSAALRFKYGRVSAKIAWPDFPHEWHYTLAWHLEKK